MSTSSDTVARIRELGLVVVVRAPKADDNLMKAIEAVHEGGVSAIEITFTVPDAVSVIRKVAERFGEDVLLGAGTVLTPLDAVAAVNAGARYVISPGTNPDVISIAKALGVAVLPGAFTPTEVMLAWSSGADMVKVFPASIGGAELIKSLRGPFPTIPFVPTGGVNLDTVADFVDAGAAALAVGGNLFDKKLVASGDFAALTKLAASYVEAVKKARSA